MREFTAAYAHEFVLALLRTLSRFRDHESAHDMLVVEGKWFPDTFPWHKVDAVSRRSEKPGAELLKGLLGHPPPLTCFGSSSIDKQAIKPFA